VAMVCVTNHANSFGAFSDRVNIVLNTGGQCGGRSDISYPDRPMCVAGGVSLQLLTSKIRERESPNSFDIATSFAKMFAANFANFANARVCEVAIRGWPFGDTGGGMTSVTSI
jgi:hypothetical protein